MEVHVADTPPTEVEADLLCLGLFEGDELPDPFASAPGAPDVKPGYKKLAVLRPERPARVAVVGLGARDEFDPERARIAAEAENRARELQDLPSNVATPSYLAERAQEIAADDDRIAVEVLGREEIERLEMGGLISVSRGSHEEPRFIVLRYRGGADGSGLLALVGKAVTFDSGGISIKPASRMNEMKMDMSGGAAVIEALAAIAELGLPLNVLAAVPAPEDMPSGHAAQPGAIITQHNGKTVEIINTDAEGRLILADALSWCAQQGADRIINLATLTGAVLVALGSTYSGLISNDDEWAERVRAAGEET